ncbi:hypothetical protein Tco_0769391 [Tanacetum coccineum]|uniref:Uncharacterized protein n=1 Tax=Tanacetum coccineum TaxID=301880 RepID=A0ABQ4ZCJ2_9ASTR
MVKSWLVQDQTVLELAIPEQTATGKGILNPLMAGSLPKTVKPTELDVPRANGYCSLWNIFIPDSQLMIADLLVNLE